MLKIKALHPNVYWDDLNMSAARAPASNLLCPAFLKPAREATLPQIPPHHCQDFHRKLVRTISLSIISGSSEKGNALLAIVLLPQWILPAQPAVAQWEGVRGTCITEWLRLGGTSGGHLSHHPAQAVSPRAHCPRSCTNSFWIPLRTETP